MRFMGMGQYGRASLGCRVDYSVPHLGLRRPGPYRVDRDAFVRKFERPAPRDRRHARFGCRIGRRCRPTQQSTTGNVDDAPKLRSLHRGKDSLCALNRRPKIDGDDLVEFDKVDIAQFLNVIEAGIVHEPGHLMTGDNIGKCTFGGLFVAQIGRKKLARKRAVAGRARDPDNQMILCGQLVADGASDARLAPVTSVTRLALELDVARWSAKLAGSGHELAKFFGVDHAASVRGAISSDRASSVRSICSRETFRVMKTSRDRRSSSGHSGNSCSG